MNTQATPVAGTAASPAHAGLAAGAHAGTIRRQLRHVSSGIRGAGQYCCFQAQTGTEPNMTARRMTRGMMAARGMCP